MSDQGKELPGTAATKKSNAGRSRTYDTVGFEQTLHDPANKLVVAGRTGRSLMHPQEGVSDPQDRNATNGARMSGARGRSGVTQQNLSSKEARETISRI